jgi:hypothetical protein
MFKKVLIANRAYGRRGGREYPVARSAPLGFPDV